MASAGQVAGSLAQPFGDAQGTQPVLPVKQQKLLHGLLDGQGLARGRVFESLAEVLDRELQQKAFLINQGGADAFNAAA